MSNTNFSFAFKYKLIFKRKLLVSIPEKHIYYSDLFDTVLKNKDNL